jgi:battenin
MSPLPGSTHPNLKKRHYEPINLEPVDVEGDEVAVVASSCNNHLALFRAFWMLGMLNNASYVIMIACAKNISEGGTGLVFLANVVPSLCIKLSSPWWFDRVGYNTRMILATLCMVLSFLLIATSHSIGNHRYKMEWQLLGVALASAQCGLGESSLLALAGKRDSQLHLEQYPESGTNNMDPTEPPPKGQCLTCFSSGTGIAGVFGFFWKWFWNEWLGFSLSVTLWLAMSLAISYISVYRGALWYDSHSEMMIPIVSTEEEVVSHESQALQTCLEQEYEIPAVTPIDELNGWQRLTLVLSLWPYMVPLFVVYIAEYALQAGTWTAIGFPLQDQEARDSFYEFSNWMYQAGVFVSRSSGTLFTAPMWVLWLMPALQSVNVIFFSTVASHPDASWIYDPNVLYPLCFYVGLLGGAVYISGYKRICADLPVAHREFSLSATSVAEGAGILVADILGLFIQSCLYQVNGLQGAVVACPLR